MLRLIFCLITILQISVESTGQHSGNTLNNAILGSVHLTSFNEDIDARESVTVPGVALEYRTNIDSLSSRFHLSFGASLESVALKSDYEDGSFFRNTQFNLTLPFGLYYQIAETFFFGLYTSMDLPFASAEKSSFSGVEFSNSEFNFRYLNINFSAGVNFTKTFTLNDHQILVELHYKALGILGLKSNDYWHYPEDSIPYYYGLRLGYGF